MGKPLEARGGRGKEEGEREQQVLVEVDRGEDGGEDEKKLGGEGGKGGEGGGGEGPEGGGGVVEVEDEVGSLVVPALAQGATPCNAGEEAEEMNGLGATGIGKIERERL